MDVDKAVQAIEYRLTEIYSKCHDIYALHRFMNTIFMSYYDVYHGVSLASNGTYIVFFSKIESLKKYGPQFSNGAIFVEISTRIMTLF